MSTVRSDINGVRFDLQLIASWIEPGSKVLDLGCGTGVLAILAEKMGAGEILALDNDPLACRNALENMALNECRKIRVICGDLSSLEEHSFNTVLGNINLNILLKEMKNISNILVKNGIAILGGFYQEDLKTLNETVHDLGFSRVGEHLLNGWTVAVYRKGN